MYWVISSCHFSFLFNFFMWLFSVPVVVAAVVVTKIARFCDPLLLALNTHIIIGVHQKTTQPISTNAKKQEWPHAKGHYSRYAGRWWYVSVVSTATTADTDVSTLGAASSGHYTAFINRLDCKLHNCASSKSTRCLNTMFKIAIYSSISPCQVQHGYISVPLYIMFLFLFNRSIVWWSDIAAGPQRIACLPGCGIG